MVEILEQLKGQHGITTDEVFSVITDTLAKAGQVVEDTEHGYDPDWIEAWAELVTTKYKVGKKMYELWYQTCTPFSPKGMVCSFGFDEIEK